MWLICSSHHLHCCNYPLSQSDSDDVWLIRHARPWLTQDRRIHRSAEVGNSQALNGQKLLVGHLSSGSYHHRSTSCISLSASDLKIKCEMDVKLQTLCVCCSNVGDVVENGIARFENKPFMWWSVTEMAVFCYFWDLNKETPSFRGLFWKLGKNTTRGIVFLCLIWPGDTWDLPAGAGAQWMPGIPEKACWQPDLIQFDETTICP